MMVHHDNAKIFTALSDVTRLQILELLRTSEKNATDIQMRLGIGQSTLSHHLKILTESGIISPRKERKWTYYAINEKGSRYAAALVKLLTTKTINQPKKRSDTMKKPFTIVVDTSCDLPPGYMEEHGIGTIPVPFTLNNVPHEQGYWQEITEKAFYQNLRDGGISKTSLINPDTFVKSFTHYAQQKNDVLYIILSSALSGTFQSAQLALNEVADTFPDCNIYPVDSIGATGLNGLLAMLAVQKRNEGLNAAETAAFLEEKKNKIHGFFTVDDLMYLYRGGRLGKLSALGGSLLGIKPILSVKSDGALTLYDKIRGRNAALKLLVKQLKKAMGPLKTVDTLYVAHTDCVSDAEKLADLVRQSITVNKLIIQPIGPVIGSHLGPGAVALLFEGGLTRDEYAKTKAVNG
jgi:DegV family protein with EDD domain